MLTKKMRGVLKPCHPDNLDMMVVNKISIDE